MPRPSRVRSGLELADGYTVLAVSLARHPDERNPHVRPEVVARRTLRRVEVELEAICDGKHLALLGPEGGTVLLAQGVDVARGRRWRRRRIGSDWLVCR